MFLRPMRAPIALLASLGLLAAMTAIPAVAQTSTPACTAEGESTGEVADGVTLTYDSSFACTDAADTGTWAITVNLAVSADSTAGVQITDATLSHTSPRPGGTGPDATATPSGLPVDVPVDGSASFDIAGDYELVQADDGNRAILHLRLSGATDDDEPFLLGVNVQILAPGLEPEIDDETGFDPDPDHGDGRPEWVPGPPPWVRDLLESLFPNGFPWGTDDFPPAIGRNSANAEADAEAEVDAGVTVDGRPDWVPGPPPWVPLPAQAGAEAELEVDAGPPDWVSPGGPPAWVPGAP